MTRALPIVRAASVLSLVVLGACGGSGMAATTGDAGTGVAGSSGAGCVGGEGVAGMGGGGADGLGGAAGAVGGAGGRRSAALVEIARVGGLGFCIRPNQIARGRIEHDAATSALVFSGTVHLDWSGSVEVTEEVGPTALGDAQRAELETRLALLPDVACNGTISPVCDPCLESRIAVDGVQHVSNPCAIGCDDLRPVVDSVGAFFDSLATGTARTAR